MVIKSFPSVENTDEYGVLAIGGDLEIDSLLLAYKSGIFPWPFDEEEIVWFAPPTRAVLFLDDYHISRSLTRLIKQGNFKIKKDQDFESVIDACANVPRRDQNNTWITTEMIDAYCMLHHAGYAHSYEIYMNGFLVGGLYGVQIGKLFAAESMFHKRSNASKLALNFLVEDLKQQGITWFDCQVQNDFLKTFGVKEITRKKYMQLLTETFKS